MSERRVRRQLSKTRIYMLLVVLVVYMYFVFLLFVSTNEEIAKPFDFYPPNDGPIDTTSGDISRRMETTKPVDFQGQKSALSHPPTSDTIDIASSDISRRKETTKPVDFQGQESALSRPPTSDTMNITSSDISRREESQQLFRDQVNRNVTPQAVTSWTEAEMRSKALRSQPQNNTLFPPYMFWTIERSSKLTRAEKTLRQKCERMNPNYQAREYDNEASRSFVEDKFPEFLSLYDGLDKPVMRADMWRYLILFHYGGVYFDLDVECLKPIDHWGADVHSSSPRNKTTPIRAMVGIEFRDTEGPFTSLLQFVQFTMAADVGHPIFYRAVQLINETVSNIRVGGPSVGDAEYVTGPKIFTRAVVEYLVKLGRLTDDQVIMSANKVLFVNDTTITKGTDEQIGDLAILHKNAFGYHQLHKGVTGEKYVKHLYAGRWRVKDHA
jgi:alpha 1,6-mannosyltransferase